MSWLISGAGVFPLALEGVWWCTLSVHHRSPVQCPVIRLYRALSLYLQLWDIAGQDRFVKLTRAYFAKGASILSLRRYRAYQTYVPRSWKSQS